MGKRRYRKRRKRDQGKPYIRKNKFILGEEGHISEIIKFISARVEKKVKEETVYLEQFF